MKNFYQIILTISEEDEKGKIKNKKEYYLVEADSIEEASNIIRMKEAEYGGRDYEIDTIKLTKYISVYIK